ncbi:BON domain-containing protein [Planctomicrobium sp. SH664]|uniref:BON domain-containing protein n=1 Tax=Planctomicrobium sp. SH664 TaxID=3448125 RepID=UPI003F5C445E
MSANLAAESQSARRKETDFLQRERHFTLSSNEQVRHRLDDADIVLRARIKRSLLATGRQPLSGLQVSTSAGVVTLQGTVPSYYMKQLAQQAAMDVPGVTRIDSQLVVTALATSKLKVPAPSGLGCPKS